jgi:hypothetical protein
MADTLRSERSPRNRVGVQLPPLAYELFPIPLFYIMKSFIGMRN